MPNTFDALEARLHRTTTRVFGYSAVWLPSFGGDPITVRVNLKDPSKWGTESEVDKVDYGLSEPILEYFEGDFPGLEHSANNGGDESLIVSTKTGLWRYNVLQVNKVHDGSTYYAICKFAGAP